MWDGLLFAEYSFFPERHPQDRAEGPIEVPEAELVDGDDAGCFCGHVYVEAIDAIDLNGIFRCYITYHIAIRKFSSGASDFLSASANFFR